MLLSLPLALLCLTHGVQSAAVASTTVTSFSPDTKLVTNDVALQNWTKVEVGHPSSVGSEVAAVAAPTPKTSVVMAVIASNTALAAATCTAGIIWLCATSVIATILSNFFLLFVPSSGPTDASNVKRADLPTITHFVHEAWLPTESCSTFCQLKAGSAHGDWTHFTNTTVDGVVHDVHFRQNGNLMGLRAVRQSSTANKRDDNSDDDGVVAAYFWEDNNQQA